MCFAPTVPEQESSLLRSHATIDLGQLNGDGVSAYKLQNPKCVDSGWVAPTIWVDTRDSVVHSGKFCCSVALQFPDPAVFPESMCVEKENDVVHGRRGISVKIGSEIPGTVLLYYRTAGKVRVRNAR